MATPDMVLFKRGVGMASLPVNRTSATLEREVGGRKRMVGSPPSSDVRRPTTAEPEAASMAFVNLASTAG